MAIKSKSYEKLSFDNIEKVVGLLEDESPITKKEACEILNIRYNTTRLQRIIEEHNDTKLFRETRKNQNKGKPASRDEVKTVVQYYLDGENISSIANSIYRSPAFVKNIVERLGVPQKLADSDYQGMRKSMLPEQCVSDKFTVGEKVWSPKNNKFAEIVQEYDTEYYRDNHGCPCYRLWVLEPCDTSQTFFPWIDGSRTGFTSFALAYELGSLRHLEEYL
tara:strand:+ start:324 stop:983 length:660 start_codon:yes stop_codon:yes gene_type:complete